MSIRLLRNRFFLFGLAVVVPTLIAVLLMPGFLELMFSSERFMPHATCYLNNQKVIWMHVVSDSSIGAAYIAISGSLAYLVYRARKDIPFEWMFLAFGLFIFTCAWTHLLEVWTVWKPTYWFSGAVKVVTAIASVATAIGFQPLVPRIFGLIETAKASEERKKAIEIAHRELAIKNLQLKELDELKSQFFANVSHELRTPLALILGPTEELLSAENLTSEQRHTIEVLRRNGRILLRHVDNLLDGAKLESGEMVAKYRQFDIARLLRVIASNFETLADQRGVEYQVVAPAELVMEGDPDKLERVITNLLSNAFKFTPERGRIICSMELRGDQTVLKVEDSGPGIPAEMRDVIFERFRQVDSSSSRRHGGTGLGLTIAKEFVALHNGSIVAGQSRLGGALFSVHLPVKAPAGVEVIRQAVDVSIREDETSGAIEELHRDQTTVWVASDEQEMSREGRPPVVLVVEDNPEMNEAICDWLRHTYQTVSATNGADGLAKARALHPDLILTDLMMPEVTGEELLKALREDKELESVPVMLLTAKADDRLRTKLLRQGAQDYLTKPFLPDELRARVRNLVSSAVSRRRLEAAHQELESFSYSVAHDLRAPLRAIRVFAEIVLEEPNENLSEQSRDYLKRISEAGTRLDQLLEDLLAYSRVARTDLQLNPVDVEQLIREIIRERPEFQEPKAVIGIHPIPPVLGHPAFLTQCVSNLLGNSVKFTEAGVQPKVKIWSEMVGAKVRIWFEDNGIGIDPRHHQQIFELFHRTHHPEQFPGTGVGLAIVRKAVERMGGKVGVASELNHGSRFWVELRRA